MRVGEEAWEPVCSRACGDELVQRIGPKRSAEEEAAQERSPGEREDQRIARVLEATRLLSALVELHADVRFGARYTSTFVKTRLLPLASIGDPIISKVGLEEQLRELIADALAVVNAAVGGDADVEVAPVRVKIAHLLNNLADDNALVRYLAFIDPKAEEAVPLDIHRMAARRAFPIQVVSRFSIGEPVNSVAIDGDVVYVQSGAETRRYDFSGHQTGTQHYHFSGDVKRLIVGRNNVLSVVRDGRGGKKVLVMIVRTDYLGNGRAVIAAGIITTWSEDVIAADEQGDLWSVYDPSVGAPVLRSTLEGTATLTPAEAFANETAVELAKFFKNWATVTDAQRTSLIAVRKGIVAVASSTIDLYDMKNDKITKIPQDVKAVAFDSRGHIWGADDRMVYVFTSEGNLIARDRAPIIAGVSGGFEHRRLIAHGSLMWLVYETPGEVHITAMRLPPAEAY
jgi:hypothetical protein